MPELQNRFTSGMVQDALPSLSNPETYKMARNAIHQSRDASNFGLVNEESNSLVATVSGTIKGYSHIEERNQTLLFVYNGGASELHIFSHIDHSVTFVCSDQEFGCNWGFDKCEFLYGEFKQFNACNELHVYWSSDCIYHVVNIDEMLNPVRKAAIPQNECSRFDVFKAVCGPKLSALPSKNAGSTMEGGSVRFAIQLKDNDGNLSNVFDISQPVYLETDDNISTQVSNMSAKLTVDGLDPEWNDAIIYVIHNSGQSTVIKKMPVASYGDKGFTFDYYGQDGELVDVSVLINKKNAWLRGQDLIQHDGRLFLYNIKNERNLNYQKYANGVQVKWVEFEVSMEQQMKYHFPSLMRGEIYAIAIVWRYLDGTYSPAFHIPGAGGGGGTTPATQTTATAAAADASSVDFFASVRSTASDQYCYDFVTGDCVICNQCLSEDCNPCVPDDDDSGGGIGDGEDPIDGGSEDTYRPMFVKDIDTNDQFERERNPNELKDRPNESDNLENAVRRDVNNITTNEEDIKESGECHDNLYGCGEAEEALREDLDDVSQVEQNHNVLMSDYGRDRKDEPVDKTSNLKDAAVYMIDEAVIEREYITKKKPELDYSGANLSGPGKAPEDPKPSVGEESEQTLSQSGSGDVHVGDETLEAGSIRGDNWVDSVGNPQTDEPPRVVDRGFTTAWSSSVQYPDHRDCDGNRFYPEGNIQHHRIPWSSERPHFVSFQNGVVNKYQPENYEYGKTYVRPMGLQVSNVQFPTEDELPKPLCPKSPYKIVYVKRTDQNKSVFAKGWFSGTFNGDVYGTQYAYPRHGVNSFEHVDRMISPQGNPNSRMGAKSSEPIYTFHSPDTDCDNSYLPATNVKPELALLGNGWRHGLYAKGKEPENDQWHGTRKDNRGARVANNLNHYTQVGGGNIPIQGLTYAPSNTVVSPASNMSKPLMNRFRESSVYIETAGNLPGDQHDKSFVGDVRNHFAPTEANAPYGALVRNLPDQYGSVEGLRYIDLGLVATKVHYPGESGAAPALEGICGDTFIGPYSKRRTSYVSNKQGDFFGVPPKPGSPCRERSICDSPDDKIFQVFGIDHYPSKLPKSGDRWDPKNYAGLHTTGADTCGGAYSKMPGEAADTMISESDWYYPRTLKSLVHCIAESHVNPFLLETGSGSQLQDGRVYYPKLKDLYLDADAPAKHPWEESFLTRFYGAVEHPSRKQLWLKMMFRTTLNGLMPAGLLTQFQNLEAIVDTASMMFVAPMLIALWLLGNHTLFNDRRINQILGIEDCLRDEEGGDLDEDIENFEDAYCRYSWDYSQVNDSQPYYAFPLPYNTCDCDSCDKENTNLLVYHTNKQNLDSELDAYRSVLLNNYGELPAHAGKLQRLFVQGQGFYAHCTDGIWMLKLRQESIPNQIAFQQSGTGELLAEPQLLFEGVAEGFAGTEHPNAAINTAFGYFFIDDNAKKIYRFNGSPEEISAYGMYHFFKENLGLCQYKACFDEKTQDGTHYALGWDPRYNRFLITKQDGNGCSSFSASYSPLGIPTQGGGSRGKWISFHDYKPSAYLWDRNNFYSMRFGAGEIWKHHSKGSYGNFYGTSYPFEVEFSAVAQNLESFDFEYLILDTEAEINTNTRYETKSIDRTFNKVAVWNSTQGTGTLPIIVVSDNRGARKSQLDRITSDYSRVRFHVKRRNWRANELKNLVKEDCVDLNQLITDCDCQVIPDINEEIYDCSTMKVQDYNNRILSDKYLTFRYTLDDRDDMRLYVKLHKVYTDEKKIPKQD